MKLAAFGWAFFTVTTFACGPKAAEPAGQIELTSEDIRFASEHGGGNAVQRDALLAAMAPAQLTHSVRRRAIVQAYLAAVEAAEPESQLTSEDIQRFYDENGTRYDVPERRRVDILTVGLSADRNRQAIRDVLNGLIAELHERPERFSQFLSGPRDYHGLTLELTQTTLLDRTAQAERDLKEAVWSATSIGVVDRPVVTGSAMHVVVVREILPAHRRTLGEVRAEVVSAITSERRMEQLSEQMAAVQGRVHLEQRPDLDSLLGKLSFGDE